MMDTELSVEGLDSAVDQQKLESAIASLPGVESIGFEDQKISIRHDVEAVNEKQLRAAISQAGYHVSCVESDSTQPVVEPKSVE